MTSSRPPCVLTPAGSPDVVTGTATRMRLVKSMRLRSTCSRWPRTGSCCSSTTITGVVSPPATSDVKDGVVAGLTADDLVDRFGVDRDRHRIFECTIDDARDQSRAAGTARLVLAARLTNLRGDNRICSQFKTPLRKSVWTQVFALSPDRGLRVLRRFRRTKPSAPAPQLPLA